MVHLPNQLPSSFFASSKALQHMCGETSHCKRGTVPTGCPYSFVQ